MLQPLYQVPRFAHVRGLRSRPNSADEELLQQPRRKKGILEEPTAQTHGWWCAVLAAASQLGRENVELPGLAPLRCFEALDVSKLSRLWHLEHLADGQRYLSVVEFLRFLGCPDAARLAQQELQDIAQQALQTGTFEGNVLQVHHLAILQWAGVQWMNLQGCPSALHSLCLGAAGRSWMGGGGSVAPLRGGAWGAKARFLMQRKEWVPKWQALDARGCLALNHLLPPVKPPSDCVGTATFEIVQSLFSWMAKSSLTSEVQLEAGRAALCFGASSGVSAAAINLAPLQWPLPPEDGEEVSDFFDFVISEPAFTATPALTILEPLGCAFAECRFNFFQAHRVMRRALAPCAQLRLLKNCAKGAAGRDNTSEPGRSARARDALEEKKDAWNTRRDDFERRLARLEMELNHAAALPPVVSSGTVEGKETANTQVSRPLKGDFAGRKEARTLIKKIRSQRMLEAAPSGLQKSVERAKVSLSAAVDRLAQDLYELEGHFVFELVQNADDNSYDPGAEPELRLSLLQSSGKQFFLAQNNECGLRSDDVVAMCDINASSKSHRSGCIGKKGIGWKSTFAVSNCPHVLSGCFTFKFDVASMGKLGYVTPAWLSEKELKQLPGQVQDAHRQGGTVIYLPLRSGSHNGILEAFDELLQNHVTLLFLKRLRRISFGYPDGRHVAIQTGEDHLIYKTERKGLVEVGGNAPDETKSCVRFALHQFSVPEEDVRFALGHSDEIALRLAFPLESENPAVMSVHVGLPVRAVGFCFAVDGPFDLVASRRDLHEGSAMNRLICDAIPEAFREFMATAPREMSAMAIKMIGADIVPRPLWLHVRQKLLESLTEVACVLTECGVICAPSDALRRPKHPLAQTASELISPELLKISCGRYFAASESHGVEVLALQHWLQVLSFRGATWPKGIVSKVLETWENPVDFFLPLCRWLEMELKEAEQPSEVLRQIWDLDLLPAFRCLEPLRLSVGDIYARPCVKIRTEWQGALCDAQVLRIVEPRCRCALQSVAPFLLESLTWPSPTRAELAASCLRWHLTEFDPIAVEQTKMKAVLASLACLKEVFLAGEIPEAETSWAELGKRLWIPSVRSQRVVLQRPSQLFNHSFLGAPWVDADCEGAVSLEIRQSPWADSEAAALGWEAFLDAIGVAPLQGGDMAEVGQRLCSRQWWGDVQKLGDSVVSYVQKRCQAETGPNYLGALPVAVRGKERGGKRKISTLRHHFLHEVYHHLGGSYLQYVQLPEGSDATTSTMKECLRLLGVQVQVTVGGLVKALKMLRTNRCTNIEVFADIYKEITLHRVDPEQRETLRELVFVAGGFRTVEDCTWDEDERIQWLTKVPSLKVSYHRYGPPLRRFFFDVLQMAEVHPGFRPSCLITALKSLVEHVDTAMSRNRGESLPGTPITAGQLLDSVQALAADIYSALAQACRRSSLTWHADVRRAFVQERLLLLPCRNGQGPTTSRGGTTGGTTGGTATSSTSNGSNGSNGQTESGKFKPKRLFTKEAWWDVENELAESKAKNLSLRPFYEEKLGASDAEFLFLRVLGVRKRCSRADIAHRLKTSMSSPGPLSNWAEGIHITDLEDLEDIQTSSYFRPPDWRSPDESPEGDTQQDAPRSTESTPPSMPPASPVSQPYQPPPATSPHPPAWRSAASAADAAKREEAALAAQRARRTPQPQPAAQPAAQPSQRPSATANGSRSQRQQSPPSAPRHRFAWREPPQDPVERQPLTWSQLRAQQEQQSCLSAEPPPKAPSAAKKGMPAEPKQRPPTRASAWASFRREQAVQHDGAGITPEQTDAEVLRARLVALQQTAQQRRGQVEALCSERKQVEDTAERYLRILQEFYDNM